MPYKGGVQLLPDAPRRQQLSSYTSGNGYFWTGVMLGVGIVVLGAVISGYSANLTDAIGALDGQLSQLEKTRDRDQEAALAAAAQQSKVIRTLMANKLYWSQALTQMERMTQSSVRFINIAGAATEETLTFSGFADSYATVARQLAAFTAGTGVKDASIDFVKSTTQGTVQFDGKLMIDVKTLLNKSATP